MKCKIEYYVIRPSIYRFPYALNIVLTSPPALSMASDVESGIDGEHAGSSTLYSILNTHISFEFSRTATTILRSPLSV
jgi:hypothetical protein